jgi:hypothetical protein
MNELMIASILAVTIRAGTSLVYATIGEISPSAPACSTSASKA